MRILMATTTNYQDVKYPKNEIKEVDDKTAARWLKKGIAARKIPDSEIVPVKEAPATVVQVPEVIEEAAEENNPNVPIDELGIKDLKALAKEIKLPGYSRMNREALIKGLTNEN